LKNSRNYLKNTSNAQNGRRREQKAFKPLQDYLKLFLRHDTSLPLTCIRSCVSGTYEKIAGDFAFCFITAIIHMKPETRRSLRELSYYSSLGLSVSLSIFIGLALGIYLDRKFDTHPWLAIICLVLGIAAGYRNIGLAIKKIRKL
jgi:ATP synthase protein I